MAKLAQRQLMHFWAVTLRKVAAKLQAAVKLQAKTIGRLAVQSAGAIIKMEHMIGRQGSVGSEEKLTL